MSPEASELVLYTDNEEPLYRQKMLIFRALAKKKDRGHYEPKLAPKAFAALLNAAAKKYVREFGGPGDRWNLLFSPMHRRHAAVHFATEFLDWYEVDYKASAKPSTRST
ncbi:MAG TPA: hypothetical protein VG937_00130 [Polyangiaceae bacterium]|nr:hypothetical protein [Polyangiaceae bacterium]